MNKYVLFSESPEREEASCSSSTAPPLLPPPPRLSLDGDSDTTTGSVGLLFLTEAEKTLFRRKTLRNRLSDYFRPPKKKEQRGRGLRMKTYSKLRRKEDRGSRGLWREKSSGKLFSVL
jgi:hypothetical protein